MERLFYFRVPICLCEYAIINQIINPFKLYLYLKTEGDRLTIDSALKKRAAEMLGFKTIKTVDANLKVLLNLNWVGYNNNLNTYHVRGFKNVSMISSAKRNVYVLFYESDFKTFRGFVAGALFGFLSVTQLWNERNRNKGTIKGVKSGTPSQLTRPPYFFPVSLKGFSILYKKSQSTAHSFKEDAVKGKYIDVKNNLIPLDIPPEQIMLYSKANPIDSGKLKVLNGEVYRQGPLLVKRRMHYSSGK